MNNKLNNSSHGHSHSNNNNNNIHNSNVPETELKQRISTTITNNVTTPKVMTTSNGTSTINLTGPVTDL